VGMARPFGHTYTVPPTLPARGHRRYASRLRRSAPRRRPRSPNPPPTPALQLHRSDRPTSYLPGDPYPPPTLTRGGPTNGVRSEVSRHQIEACDTPAAERTGASRRRRVPAPRRVASSFRTGRLRVAESAPRGFRFRCERHSVERNIRGRLLVLSETWERRARCADSALRNLIRRRREWLVLVQPERWPRRAC